MYAAAKKLRDQVDGDLILDLRGIPQTGQQKGSSLIDLNLPHDGVVMTNFFFQLLHKKLLFWAHKGKNHWLTRWRFPTIVRKLDEGVRLRGAKVHVIGHFQYGSLKHVLSETREIDLSGIASSLFDSIFEEIDDETIGVHIRMGDALKLVAGRGVVGAKYYEEAFAKVVELHGTLKTIIVFSDDADRASKIIKNLGIKPPRLRVVGSEISAAETLVLLSHMPTLIISNSTLSWWAANINRTKKLVISPRGWTRDGHIDLNDDSWAQIDPNWID